MILAYYKKRILDCFRQPWRKFRLRLQGNQIGSNSYISPNAVFEGNNYVGMYATIGRNVTLGRNVRIGSNTHLEDCIVGENSIIDGFCNFFGKKDKPLIIGKDCHFSPFSNLECTEEIRVGNHVSAGPYLKIVTHSGHLQALTSEVIGSERGLEKAPVVIGDYVYLGIDSTILMGVTIGSYSIVSAGSLLTRSIPNNSIVRGIPGRIIGNIDVLGDKVIIKY